MIMATQSEILEKIQNVGHVTNMDGFINNKI